MRVTVTGATGLLGRRLVAALQERGDEVTVLSRDPNRAREALGDVRALAWDLLREPAPAQALKGADAVVHLAGENVAQRWSESAKRAIRESRVTGTRNLVEGLRAVAAGMARPGDMPASRGATGDVPEDSTLAGDTPAGSGAGGDAPAGSTPPGSTPPGGAPRHAEMPAAEMPAVLVSASAVGYYGAHGDEPLDEEAPAGGGFLARVCAEWEQEARRAGEVGLRTVQLRTGVVLDRAGGALAKMLPVFRAGIGGPVAGGRQFVSWVHPDDLVGIAIAAAGDERWTGPVNGTAPEPVTNRELTRALARTLHRPAVLPVPGLALRALYGEMAQVVTDGARVMPAKALMAGYEFRYPHLGRALAAALG